MKPLTLIFIASLLSFVSVAQSNTSFEDNIIGDLGAKIAYADLRLGKSTLEKANTNKAILSPSPGFKHESKIDSLANEKKESPVREVNKQNPEIADVAEESNMNVAYAGFVEIYSEAPSSGNHRGTGTQNATGLVYRASENPISGDPILQVRNFDQKVGFFVEHDGWTGARDNSAWFGGSKDNYFEGNVGIGTANPDSKLTVKGHIHTQEVKVDLDGAVAPDYVFEKEYNLLTLDDVQDYIEQNGHLPNIPSAKEMEEEGVNLKEMNLKLLEKVEELTLYAIQQQEELENQEEENALLEERLTKLEKMLKTLTKE